MADEKPAGGGWNWGMVEIIIGILLLIGVLDHLFGAGSVSKNAPSTKSDAPVVEQADGSTCGLSLFRPRSNEKVTTIITIAGSAGDCDWRTTKDIAIFAQIVDSKGKPVSAYTAIPPSRSYEGGASFDSSIALTGKPASGTGYLILVPAIQPSGTHTVSTRIPLKF